MTKKTILIAVCIATLLSSCAQRPNQPNVVIHQDIPVCKKQAPIAPPQKVEVGVYHPEDETVNFEPVTPVYMPEPVVEYKPIPVAHITYQPTKPKTVIENKFHRLTENASRYWGKTHTLTPSNHQLVKYLDKYQSRAHIDFIHNQLTVSTVDQINSKQKLQQAIVAALLMPDNPNEVDVFSDKQIILDGEPFLFGQVKDQDHKDIRWKWRANRFADYLIQHRLKSKKIESGTLWYVDIPLVTNNLKLREYKYSSIVRKAAKKYGIQEDLLYAIIKTESSFNPFAISHAGAYGLMQVIPSTAGADVFSRLKHRNDKPTAKYLFNAYNNIDTGAGYFYILKNQYFKNLKNDTSRTYSMISAYNGGSGAVYNVFNHNRELATKRLNTLPSHTVYHDLTTKHPQQEARNYLKRVVQYKKDFNNGKI